MIESEHCTSNQITYNTPESFQFAAEIHQPFGKIDHVIQWCKHEMTAPEWKWQMVEGSTNFHPGRYIFYFNNDRDFCAFKLKWT